MIKIGLTDFTPENKLINIRDKNKVIKAKYAIGKDDILKYTLMTEHYIEISFELNRYVPFKRSDYIEWEGDKYTLREDYQPEQVNKRKYKYTLKFEAIEMFFQDIQYYYLNQGLKESEWRLTGNPQYFIKIAVDNVNRYFGTTDFKVGTIEPTQIKDITFEVNTNTFNALTQVADDYDAEWYITDKTIHLLNKVSFGDEVDFETEVSVLSMKREEGESTTPYTRILALGSTRNIPNNYRTTTSNEAVDAIYPKRLRIPTSKGDVIDAYANMSPDEVVEATVIFDEVYPKRVGTIEAVGTIGYQDVNEDTGEVTKWNAYKFKDSGINFKEEYMLPGQELKLQFTSGDLNGRDFSLKFHPKDFSSTDSSQFFEIVRTDEYGKLLPNDIIKPKAGDKYVLYGFNIALVSDQYVPAGEQELYNVATEWQKKQLRDTGVYECLTIIQYFKDHQMDLTIGQKVRLIKEIGNNRNIVRRSRKIDIKAIKGSGADLTISVDMVYGETYTLSYESTDLIISNGYPKFYIWEYFNWNKLQNLGDISVKCRTFKCTLPTGRYTFTIYNHDYPLGGTINKLKLEKGNKATDWSEAPEDVSDSIRSSRIMGFEKKLYNKFDAIYTVGDNPTYSRFGKIEQQIKQLQVAGVSVEGVKAGNGVYVIKQFDSTTSTDFNVYSAKASDAKYFNKQTGDAVQGNTLFQKNIQIMGTTISDVFQNSTFTAGQLGNGFQIKRDANGQSYMEIDNMLVRREAVLNKLTIAQITSVGGQILLSLANMNCTKVEELTDSYRCYFDSNNGSIPNYFTLNDQVICRKFNGFNIKYYWALVVGYGSDYIRISKSDKDGSGIPSIGDEIIQLGNRRDVNRQSAIILSAYGSEAPSIKQYAGINSYDMTGKEVTAITPKGNKFTGSFSISTNGTTAPVYKDLGLFVNGRTYYLNDRVSHLGSYWVCIVNTTAQTPNETSLAWHKQTAGTIDINRAVDSIQIGGRNLILNSSLTKVSAIVASAANKELAVDLIEGETYTLSYTQTDLVVTNNYPQFFIWKLNDWSNLQSLGNISANSRTFTWSKPTGAYILSVYNHTYPQGGMIKELQLERGNKATSWSQAPEDVQSQIDLAQKEAEKAKSEATKAQTSASNAQVSANTANNLLSDIANDNKLDPSEKQSTKKEWDAIVSEYTKNITHAKSIGVTTATYTSAYSTLSSYITPLLSSLTTTSDIVGATFRLRFKTYYDARLDLLNAIAAKSKQLADAAQTTANNALTNANNAQNEAEKVRSEYQADFKVLNNQISSKVAQSDFNRLGERLSSAQSNITQNANSITSTVTKVNTVQSTANTALNKADTAQLTANSALNTANLKNRTYSQDNMPSLPSGGHKVGDLWYKTSLVDASGTINADPQKNCYQLQYRWNGSAWVQNNWSASKSKIEQTDAKISATVEKTGIDSLGNGETLYSKINQTAQEIKLEVNNIQVGGRNLMLNSASIPLKTIISTTPLMIVSEGSYFNNLVNGEKYLISFDARKIAGKGNLHVEFWGGNGGDIIIDSTDTFSRYGITAKYNGVKRLYIWLKDQPGQIEVKNFQFERGNKATDWSPALEDLPDMVGSSLSLADNKISLASKTIELNGNTIAKAIQAEDLKVGSRIGASTLEVLKDGTFYAKGSNREGSLVVDSGKQSIEMTSSSSATNGGNPNNNITSTVCISPDAGGIRVVSDNSEISVVSSQGILTNKAGMQAFSNSSGISAYGAVVGLGNGNLASNGYKDNFIAGVIGAAANSNDNPAPAYGGYFNILKANGLVLNTRIIDNAISVSTAVTTETTLVVSLSRVLQNVYLPSNAYNGTVIWLKQWFAGTMRIYPPEGYKLFDDATENTFLDVNHGEVAMCICLTDVSVSGSKIWLFNKHRF